MVENALYSRPFRRFLVHAPLHQVIKLLSTAVDRRQRLVCNCIKKCFIALVRILLKGGLSTAKLVNEATEGPNVHLFRVRDLLDDL